MTAMLASVTGPEEAEIAIAGGADIIDLKDPAAGAFAALPLARIIETVVAIKGRRPTSAVTGDPAMQADGMVGSLREIAATGVDYVKVGLFPRRRNNSRRSGIWRKRGDHAPRRLPVHRSRA
jgi:dihydroneopterin aldolase